MMKLNDKVCLFFQKYIYRFISAYIFIYIVLYLCFPNFKKLQSHRNALYFATTLFIGCTYIIFVKPKYFKLGNELMPKWMMYSFYLAFHILPFALVLYNIKNQSGLNYNKYESLIPCIIVGLIYLSFFNLKKIYDINFTDIVIIILSYRVVLSLIYSESSSSSSSISITGKSIPSSGLS
jgi:hypothetical protein